MRLINMVMYLGISILHAKPEKTLGQRFQVPDMSAFQGVVLRLAHPAAWNARFTDPCNRKIRGNFAHNLPALLIFLSFVSLIGNTYNPFLYFQF